MEEYKNMKKDELREKAKEKGIMDGYGGKTITRMNKGDFMNYFKNMDTKFPPDIVQSLVQQNKDRAEASKSSFSKK